MGASIRYECCMTIGMIWSVRARATWYGVLSGWVTRRLPRVSHTRHQLAVVKRLPRQTRCQYECSRYFPSLVQCSIGFGHSHACSPPSSSLNVSAQLKYETERSTTALSCTRPHTHTSPENALALVRRAPVYRTYQRGVLRMPITTHQQSAYATSRPIVFFAKSLMTRAASQTPNSVIFA